MDGVQTINVARLLVFIHGLVLDWGVILKKATMKGLGGETTRQKFALLYTKNYVTVHEDTKDPVLNSILGDSRCMFYDAGVSNEVVLNILRLIIKGEIKHMLVTWDRSEKLAELPEGFSYEQMFENIQQRMFENQLKYPKTNGGQRAQKVEPGTLPF